MRLHSIRPDVEIGAAVHTLLQKGHSGLPVVDRDGKLCGLFSEHDGIRVLAQAAAERWPQGKVADHMTTRLETVRPEDDALALATCFAKGRHRRLLVVEEGRLLGLVSRRDLLGALEALAKGSEATRRPTTYEALERRHRELD